MKGRQSRYVTGGESFAEIARLPSGAVVRLCLNTGLEDALREASKSLKSAFTRSGRKCRLSAGTGQGAKKVKMYSPGCPEVKENRHTAERRIALFAKWTSVLLCYSCFNG